MGSDYSSKSHRRKKHSRDVSNSSSPSSSSSFVSSDSKASLEKRSRHHRRRKDKRKSIKISRREKERNDSAKRHNKRKERKCKEEKRMKEEKERLRREKRDSSFSDHEECPTNKSKTILDYILKTFPDVADDLKQLLQTVDNGQAVDITGISNGSLSKQLKKLFLSLDLKESENGIFLLPPKISPTLEVIGPMLSPYLESEEQHVVHSVSPSHGQPTSSNVKCRETSDLPNESKCTESSTKDDSSAPRRRLIGPEMPSFELLAAAAKLTEAEAVLREAEVETDTDLFIGPPPPAVVAEAESANEAERFEEVTRIMGVEIENPYDVLGVNRNMSTDNIKKRYWKLSLMVHPDKCSHPQAHQAFIVLNKAFKDLQDPDKKKALDDQIRHKEEQEEFKAELHAMREAAQWRRLQGISMEGDEELLAEPILPPKREEWMTTLPPERKPGVAMHSTTSFSRSGKEGRGDASIWTDTPVEKAQKAKMNYLEAYDEAAALASNVEKKRTNADADLVDQYNRTKRSKSLVQKLQEEVVTHPKRKAKEERKKEEWQGQHPWKPWDREKDLTEGRQKVNLDSQSMAQGLSSRFSSGNFQRNFL